MINTITRIALLVSLVALFFAVRSCKENGDNVTHITQAVFDTVKHYNMVVNGKNIEVARTKAVVTNTKEMFDAYVKMMDKEAIALKNSFKSADNITRTITVTKLDTITIAAKEIPCLDKPDTLKLDSALITLHQVRYKNAWKIMRLSIPDTQTTVTGVDKMPWYKRDAYTTKTIHSNPIIHVVDQKTVTLKEKTPWYKTKLFIFSAGFVSGSAAIIYQSK